MNSNYNLKINIKLVLIIVIVLIIILKIFPSISLATPVDQDKITFEINSNIESREIYIKLKINIPQDIFFEVNTYKAKINYNKNIFEELDINSFENLSNWENLQFNKENSEIIATKKNGIKNSEEVIKIKFKLKDNIEKNTTTEISISNVQLPNSLDNQVITLKNKLGSQEEKSTITLNVENNKIEENTSNEIGNLTENETEDQNQESSKNETVNQINKNTDKNYNDINTANKIIPQLGKNSIILKILIALLIIIFIIIIFKHIKTKKVISSILIAIFIVQLSMRFVLAISGDIDENNNINLKDIIKLEEHLISLKTIKEKNELNNADINKDTKVDLVDLSLLLDLYYYPDSQNKNEEIKLETKQLGMGRLWNVIFSKNKSI